jgi:hypothetical protein
MNAWNDTIPALRIDHERLEASVRLFFFRLLLFLPLLLASFHALVVYGGTRVIQRWVAPDVANYKFDHILTICVTKDDTIRQTVEDAMAARAKKGNAFPSYNILEEADLRDKERAKRKILQMGFDGAVIMRPLRVEDRVNYVPGSYPPYYGSFWGYYGWAWPTLYAPDYVYTDRIVQVETTIFSIKEDKLLWTTLSETTNPKSARDVVLEIAKVISKEARKRGLVK